MLNNINKVNSFFKCLYNETLCDNGKELTTDKCNDMEGSYRYNID